VSHPEPMPGQPYPYRSQGGPPPPPEYTQGPPPPPGYGQPEPPPRRERRPRDGGGSARTALIVHTIADIAAVFLGLWILLYLLEANQANPFVEFVKGVADWLAWWAQDIFTMDSEGLRVFLNYGLPAAIYLLVGHGISARIRRL
jgi:hypothetical protein